MCYESGMRTTIRLSTWTWLAVLFAIGGLTLAVATDAPCGFGCARTPCFINGPACAGQCSCQWVDEISGFCG